MRSRRASPCAQLLASVRCLASSLPVIERLSTLPAGPKSRSGRWMVRFQLTECTAQADPPPPASSVPPSARSLLSAYPVLSTDTCIFAPLPPPGLAVLFPLYKLLRKCMDSVQFFYTCTYSHAHRSTKAAVVEATVTPAPPDPVVIRQSSSAFAVCSGCRGSLPRNASPPGSRTASIWAVLLPQPLLPVAVAGPCQLSTRSAVEGLGP